jgi:hypothetical protein
MADATATSPADMDPIQQTSVATSMSNIKNFGHAPDLILNSVLTNMVTNQQSQFAFNQAIQSRCLNMLLDPMSSSLADSVTGQQSAKVAQTTPPDTSGQLAALAAQISALTQILQGLSIAPSSVSKA